eukprot:CAMPEP_0114975030 /NCGR_PEP_ID=MMETSP0216-20121206/1857_1 /TAXON_ID=223996 /ORGANISM="Protocruzia adherens, Strain Boccale" /LENGTH=488 /DNA_ID=CAMNT_0002335735 /DNA_START=105 /DNA_END=1571 /DNA_ORIENTATION=+
MTLSCRDGAKHLSAFGAAESYRSCGDEDRSGPTGRFPEVHREGSVPESKRISAASSITSLKREAGKSPIEDQVVCIKPSISIEGQRYCPRRGVTGGILGGDAEEWNHERDTNRNHQPTSFLEGSKNLNCINVYNRVMNEEKEKRKDELRRLQKDIENQYKPLHSSVKPISSSRITSANKSKSQIQPGGPSRRQSIALPKCLQAELQNGGESGWLVSSSNTTTTSANSRGVFSSSLPSSKLNRSLSVHESGVPAKTASQRHSRDSATICVQSNGRSYAPKNITNSAGRQQFFADRTAINPNKKSKTHRGVTGASTKKMSESMAAATSRNHGLVRRTTGWGKSTTIVREDAVTQSFSNRQSSLFNVSGVNQQFKSVVGRSYGGRTGGRARAVGSAGVAETRKKLSTPDSHNEVKASRRSLISRRGLKNTSAVTIADRSENKTSGSVSMGVTANPQVIDSLDMGNYEDIAADISELNIKTVMRPRIWVNPT